MAIQSLPSTPVQQPPPQPEPSQASHAQAPSSPSPVPPPAPTVTSGRVALAIPLDDEPPAGKSTKSDGGRPSQATATKPVSRRDSLKRREALLRGKEGSRRRQRWENDHFVDNPHAQPPTQADWEPRPLYPKKIVPYQYASLWEHPDFPRRTVSKNTDNVDRIPRDLKARLKKAHGARGLLQALEEEVRNFVYGRDEMKDKYTHRQDDQEELVEDESEEEIVFVSKSKKRDLPIEKEKVLFEGLAEDASASFERWLVHSIARYYGLRSWSITMGNPAKRIAYVGMSVHSEPSRVQLTKVPKPLYLML